MRLRFQSFIQPGQRTALRLRRALLLPILISILLAPASSSQAQSLSPDWSQPIDITQPSGAKDSLFGVLVCDQYQNTHVLWGDQSDQGGAIFYRNDMYNGWSSPIDVIATTDPVMIRLDAAISNTTDTLYLLWVNTWINGDLYFSSVPLQEAQNPKAWSRPVLLANRVEEGSIKTDLNGNLQVVYGTSDSAGYELAVEHIRSEDGGITWSSPTPVFSTVTPVPSTARAEIAIDERGRFHVGITLRSWDYGVYSEVGYVRSVNGGQTWGDYRVVDNVATSFQGLAVLSVYAFGEDEVHLTWHDPRRLHQWSTDGGETWSDPVEIMALGAAFGGPNMLVKDSAGVLRVVTAVAGGVYSATFEGGQWSRPEKIDERRIDPHGQYINICQGNQVQVIYDDRRDSKRVWFSNRTVNAPAIERQTMPKLVPTPMPTPTTAPDLAATQQASREEMAGLLSLPHASTSQSPLKPIIFAAIPVMLFLIGVLLRSRNRTP